MPDKKKAEQEGADREIVERYAAGDRLTRTEKAAIQEHQEKRMKQAYKDQDYDASEADYLDKAIKNKVYTAEDSARKRQTARRDTRESQKGTLPGEQPDRLGENQDPTKNKTKRFKG